MRCNAKGRTDRRKVGRDEHAPREDRQDGGGSESTIRLVPHP